MLQRPPKIEDVGLKKFLDDSAAEHNGFDYDHLANMIKASVDKSNIAKAFGVNRKTVYRWLEVWEKEKQT